MLVAHHFGMDFEAIAELANEIVAEGGQVVCGHKFERAEAAHARIGAGHVELGDIFAPLGRGHAFIDGDERCAGF